MQLERPIHGARAFAQGLKGHRLVLTPLDLQHGRACLALTMIDQLVTDQTLPAEVLAQAQQAQKALQDILALLGNE